MADGTIVLGRSEIGTLVTVADAIIAIEDALVAHGRGLMRAAPEVLIAAPGAAVLGDPGGGAALAILDAGAIAALRTGAAGAVASKFLAVGTPRSIGLVGCGLDARVLLAAHRVVFAPREIRCADPDAEIAARFAADCGGRATSIEEACACDIVCTTVAGAALVRRAWIRRGTHLNAMTGTGVLDDDVLEGSKLVTVEATGATWGTLGEVAAGIKDGRELDEVTAFDGTGLGFLDVVIARIVHAEAARRHVGHVTNLQA